MLYFGTQTAVTTTKAYELFWPVLSRHSQENDLGANANLYAVLAAGFPQDHQQVAIETPAQTYSWNDINAMSGRIASLLQSLELEPGARVAVQVEKSPLALMLYLATVRAGLVYLPLNTAYKAAEVEYFLTDAEPAVIVCDSRNLSWMTDLANKTGTAHVHTLDEDGSGSLALAAGSADEVFETVQNQPDDLAAILYTSGTTGRSKGAMLTHGNLASNAE